MEIAKKRKSERRSKRERNVGLGRRRLADGKKGMKGTRKRRRRRKMRGKRKREKEQTEREGKKNIMKC